MQKILPIKRVIMRRVHWIFKIRRGRMRRRRRMETTTVRKQKVVALKRPPPFTLTIPVNIVRILKCTEHWSWNVLTAFGTITARFVRSAVTRSPRREITSKRAFFGVTIVEQLHTKKRRRWKLIMIPPLKRGTKKRINFSFLSNRGIFDSFCHWFSIIHWFLLFCVFIMFIIIGQSSENESVARRQ